jgi:hypothetical protein
MSESSVGWHVRQGDVLLTRIQERPAGEWEAIPRQGGKTVIALGEVTGHHHRFESESVCELRAEGVGTRVVSVSAESLLLHEEHGAIAVPPGLYVVEIQREWTFEDEVVDVQD